MTESTEKKNRGSTILNAIIGVSALAGVIWLVTQCPTCH